MAFVILANLAACAPAPNVAPPTKSTATPAIWVTQLPPKIALTQATPRAGGCVEVPNRQDGHGLRTVGEFLMGSDRDMAKYAKRLCEESSGDLAVATCRPAAFRDEQPAHAVRMNAFWIDRTDVSNEQYRSCVEGLPANHRCWVHPSLARATMTTLPSWPIPW